MLCDPSEVELSGVVKKYAIPGPLRKPAWVRRRLVLSPYPGEHFDAMLEVTNDAGTPCHYLALDKNEFFLVSGPAVSRMTMYHPPKHFKDVQEELVLGVCTKTCATWFAFASRSELANWITQILRVVNRNKSDGDAKNGDVLSGSREGSEIRYRATQELEIHVSPVESDLSINHSPNRVTTVSIGEVNGQTVAENPRDRYAVNGQNGKENDHKGWIAYEKNGLNNEHEMHIYR